SRQSTFPAWAWAAAAAVAVNRIAASEVAIAVLGLKETRVTSSGTIRMPPPTPNNPEKKPAARPMPTRGSFGLRTAGIVAAVDERLARLVAPLVADPRHSGVVCDIDGTLAPIVSRP